MSGLIYCLGFTVETEEQFFDLIQRTVAQGEVVETGSGRYHRWEVGEGIELWAQEDEDGELIGLNPHFAGDGAASLIVDRGYGWGEMEEGAKEADDDEAGNQMDGGFVASPIYQETVAADEELRFAFDTPDYLTYGPLTLPGLFGVQLAAFAQEMVVYPDEEAFRAEPENAELGVESFIALKLYTDEGEPVPLPRSHAVFTGKVIETRLRTNPVTGHSFQWAKVQTEDLILDLVADPEDLEEELAPDSIVLGEFWVTGRLMDP